MEESQKNSSKNRLHVFLNDKAISKVERLSKKFGISKSLVVRTSVDLLDENNFIVVAQEGNDGNEV